MKPWLQKTSFHLILIAVTGLLAYSNTFHSPFQWDDKGFVQDNPIVKDFTFFMEPSQAKDMEYYDALKHRYVGYLSFAVNYAIHGLDVTGYHIVNIAIHLLNAVLVYVLVLLTFRTPVLQRSSFQDRAALVAFFSGLLFVSHPVQIEAVTYVFQRLASLVAFFYLVSVVLYVQSRNAGGGPSRFKPAALYIGSLASAVLAMKTKENAFTLPVVIALYEFSLFGGGVKRRALRLVPHLLTMLIIPLTYVGVARPAGEVVGGLANLGYGGVSKTEYLLTQFRVVVTYIRLLFLPVHQNIYYDHPVFDSLLDPRVLLSLLFLLTLFGLAVYLFYRSRRRAGLRLVSLGIFWFFITLSIESSFIPIPMIINEYRVYLPSAGAFPAMVSSVFLLTARFQGRAVPAAAAGFLLAVSLAFCSATYARNSLWGSEIALWEDTVNKSPRKPKARVSLGNAYDEAGFPGRAMEQYRIALQLKPDNARAHYNMGLILSKEGRLDEAIVQYRTALRLDPGCAEAHGNLGIVFSRRGMPEEALRHFRAALELEPYTAEFHRNLGVFHDERGETDRAVAYYLAALRLNPDDAETSNNLGVAYGRTGKIDMAIRYLETSTRLKPYDPAFHYNLAQAYRTKGWHEKAEKHLLRARSLRRGGGR